MTHKRIFVNKNRTNFISMKFMSACVFLLCSSLYIFHNTHTSLLFRVIVITYIIIYTYHLCCLFVIKLSRSLYCLEFGMTHSNVVTTSSF